jgi:ADP-ribosylglycohydrolase
VHDVLDLRDLVADEVAQRRESGFDVSSVEADAERAIALPAVDAELARLLQRIESMPRRTDWTFVEVDDPASLIAAIRRDELPTKTELERDTIADRIHGAWLGRCAGCALGKPVEGWSVTHVRRYLANAGAWPLEDYIPVLGRWPNGIPPMKPSWPESTRGRIHGAPRDDDLDYTVVGLLALERTAGRPSSSDVAEEWLARLPFGQLFTAERAAYRSLVLGMRPPATATYRNPYREWVGALIRADIYGLAAPGDPYSAASNAAADASLSHTGNGIAAAMWAAGLISLSAAGMTAADAVDAALACIPRGSRLDVALRHVIDLHHSGLAWEMAIRLIAERNAPYSWVHSIPNASIIAASLLWGAGNYSRTIALAVAAGGDTDSTAATAGSACGASLGASGLPERWTLPLGDTLRTSVAGIATVAISHLAARTTILASARAAAR